MLLCTSFNSSFEKSPLRRPSSKYSAMWESRNVSLNSTASKCLSDNSTFCWRIVGDWLLRVHYSFFFFYWRYNPLWVCILQPSRLTIASSRTKFLDHTQRLATVGRTPLDEWSVRRRNLYLTIHNTHKTQTSMARLGFFCLNWFFYSFYFIPNEYMWVTLIALSEFKT
jgi:hypothetical protein